MKFEKEKTNSGGYTHNKYNKGGNQTNTNQNKIKI